MSTNHPESTEVLTSPAYKQARLSLRRDPPVPNKAARISANERDYGGREEGLTCLVVAGVVRVDKAYPVERFGGHAEGGQSDCAHEENLCRQQTCGVSPHERIGQRSVSG